MKSQIFLFLYGGHFSCFFKFEANCWTLSMLLCWICILYLISFLLVYYMTILNVKYWKSHFSYFYMAVILNFSFFTPFATKLRLPTLIFEFSTLLHVSCPAPCILAGRNPQVDCLQDSSITFNATKLRLPTLIFVFSTLKLG